MHKGQWRIIWGSRGNWGSAWNTGVLRALTRAYISFLRLLKQGATNQGL